MKEKFKDAISNAILKALSHIIYFIIFIVIINLISFNFYGISIPALLKDIINKELGDTSYLSKKIDYELYAISPYKGFDIDKMRNETNGYVNYYKVDYIKHNFKEIENFIDKKYLQTYKEFYIDLNEFHYLLVFNKFGYNKNKALLSLYNIIMKYKCTLEQANQALFESKIDKKIKQKFLREKIFNKLNNLLVEVLLYTKSITIDEFKRFKENKQQVYGNDTQYIWKSLIFNYSMEFAKIIRGNMCKKDTINIKTITNLRRGTR